jgi:hypothetical protein
MTGSFDELKEALQTEVADRCRADDGMEFILVKDVLRIVSVYAAAHRLVDITICGKQCPGLKAYGADEEGVYGDCQPMRRSAPTGKSCIWKPAS